MHITLSRMYSLVFWMMTRRMLQLQTTEKREHTFFIFMLIRNKHYISFLETIIFQQS